MIYTISAIEIINGGTGFVAGDTITEGVGPYKFELEVAATGEGGAVTELTIIDGGKYIDISEPIKTLAGDSPSEGTGLSVTLTYSALPPKLFRVSSVDIATGGTDFAINDTVTMMSTNSQIVLKVTTVSEGVITAVAIMDGGTFNEIETELTPGFIANGDSPSAGTGAEFSLTYKEINFKSYIIDKITILDGGTGFTTSDTLSITDPVTENKYIIKVAAINISTGAITDTEILSTGYFLFDGEDESFNKTFTNIPADGEGTGTGAEIKISFIEKEIPPMKFYTVKEIEIEEGGQGFAIDDIIKLQVGAAIEPKAILKVVAIEEGAITELEIVSGGRVGSLEEIEEETYTAIAGEVPSTGTGATINAIFEELPEKKYLVTEVEISDGGSGFAVNDLIEEERSEIKFKVTEIEGVGAVGPVKALEILDGGEMIGAGLDIEPIESSFNGTPPSTGELARLRLIFTEIIPDEYTVTSVQVTNGGTGFAVNDIITYGEAPAQIKFKVTTVAQKGIVTGLALLDGGEHIDIEEDSFTLNGDVPSTGKNLSIKVTYTILPLIFTYTVASAQAIDGGEDFIAGDIIINGAGASKITLSVAKTSYGGVITKLLVDEGGEFTEAEKDAIIGGVISAHGEAPSIGKDASIKLIFAKLPAPEKPTEAMPLYYVDGVSIINGGEGYQVGDSLTYVDPYYIEENDTPAIMTVSRVDSEGAIKGIAVGAGGAHTNDTLTIVSPSTSGAGEGALVSLKFIKIIGRFISSRSVRSRRLKRR